MKNLKHYSAFAILFAFLTSCSNTPTSNNSISGLVKDSISSNPSNYNPANRSSTYNSPDKSTSMTETDPYEMMHVAFEGSPEIEKIKPMMEAVMEMYNFPKTNDNRLKIGNMLVALRQSSVVGVTEMDILKHIYQHGSTAISLPDQAGLSSTLLETSK